MVPNPKADIIVPLGIWRGCGIADSFNGIPGGCIEATMWIEYLLGLAAGRMGDPCCLGGVGDEQNWARMAQVPLVQIRASACWSAAANPQRQTQQIPSSQWASFSSKQLYKRRGQAT